MGARDEVDYEKLSDVDLLEVFSVADEQGCNDIAGQVLDVYFARKKISPPLEHNAPGWLERWLPSVFWHQKGGGGGGR